MRNRAVSRLWRPLGAAIFLLAATGLPSGGRAAPPGSVPVLCTVILSAGTIDSFVCLRQDTDVTFSSVPTGQFLHVTDLLIVRNNLATSGEFFATIGRESGFTLPSEPRITTSGTPLRPTVLHFKTPVIVLEEGEGLAARNDSSSDFSLNIYASGYLTVSGSL